MIPKIIHYCWFGGNPLPEQARMCIASWEKFFPDYEIREWNEDNFDVTACDYVREAYEAKRWAFVSDYARFEILYQYGGVYFDTDVEVVKSFQDILKAGSFMGLEQGKYSPRGYSYCVNPGLGLAAEPGLALFAQILDHYRSIHFLDEQGVQNTTTIVEHTTNILKQQGMGNAPQIQQVAGITLYPPEYFCPLDFHTGKLTVTANTHSIHHFVASWFSKLDWTIIYIERFFAGKGAVLYYAGQAVNLPFRLVRKIRRVGIRRAAALAVKKCCGKKKDVEK